ncbi:MAG TPA: hypothetical protein VIH99_10620 [Bdellovibrionota bacterium]|jgi:hypothetical protein
MSLVFRSPGLCLVSLLLGIAFTLSALGADFEAFGDLSGQCADEDHEQFFKAKAFAMAPEGLGLFSRDATTWALNYNNTHKCGTADEYKARFLSLYDYAKNPAYLNITWVKDARAYALENCENWSVGEVEGWKRAFLAVREFFDSRDYLGHTAQEAYTSSKTWNEKNCGNVDRVNAIKARYTKEFQFAYSREGLNYPWAQAKQYAIGKVKAMTPCGDLFH